MEIYSLRNSSFEAKRYFFLSFFLSFLPSIKLPLQDHFFKGQNNYAISGTCSFLQISQKHLIAMGPSFLGLYTAVEGIQTLPVVFMGCTEPGLSLTLSYGDYWMAPTLCPHTSQTFPPKRRKVFCEWSRKIFPDPLQTRKYAAIHSGPCTESFYGA